MAATALRDPQRTKIAFGFNNLASISLAVEGHTVSPEDTYPWAKWENFFPRP